MLETRRKRLLALIIFSFSFVAFFFIHGVSIATLTFSKLSLSCSDLVVTTRMRPLSTAENKTAEVDTLLFQNLDASIWMGTPMESIVTEGNQTHSFKDVHDRKRVIQPLKICDRSTNIQELNTFNLLKDLGTPCPGSSNTKDILLIDGFGYYGRTGNQLVEFLNALQMSRDKDVALGIMKQSWLMDALLQMWIGLDADNNQLNDYFNSAFCATIFHSEDDLNGFNVTRIGAKELFHYQPNASFHEYVSLTMFSIRSLIRRYNTGSESSSHGKSMCSGIDALFRNDKDVMYTVVHSRKMNGKGAEWLGGYCSTHGCDPRGALDMTPEYIKSVLGPLGMLKRPIVLISDGDGMDVVQRLLADDEISPMLRMVPKEGSWAGGDLTLGIMSSVFFGLPVSTFSQFIVKSRLSLGFGHSYLYRVKDGGGTWSSSCGDGCVFNHRDN